MALENYKSAPKPDAEEGDVAEAVADNPNPAPDADADIDADARQPTPATEDSDDIEVGARADDVRARIAEQFAPLRAAQTQPLDSDDLARIVSRHGSIPQGVEMPEPAAADPDVQLPAAEAQPAPAQKSDDPLVTVKIDGVEKQVPTSHVDAAGGVTAYQINAAAENRLREANEILRRAQEFSAAREQHQPPQAQSGNGQHQPAPQDPAAAGASDENAAGNTSLDFKEITRAVQLGDEEEAAQALQRLFDATRSARGQDTSSEDAAARARRVYQEERDTDLSKEALDSFMTDYSDIAADARKVGLATGFAQDLMIEDLRNAGADEKYIARIPNAQFLAHVHREMRLAGTGVRSSREIYKAAGEMTRNWLGKNVSTGQQPAAPPREERKAGLTQQPPTRSAPPQKQPQQARPQTRSDIVMEMRKQRGQAVAT